MWRVLTVAESRKALPSHIQHLSWGFQSSTSTFRGVFSTASWYSFHFLLPINSSATLSRPTTNGTWTQLLNFAREGRKPQVTIFLCVRGGTRRKIGCRGQIYLPAAAAATNSLNIWFTYFSIFTQYLPHEYCGGSWQKQLRTYSVDDK